ncbi:unnamed protein product, partial [Durusdinium trenchii]
VWVEVFDFEACGTARTPPLRCIKDQDEEVEEVAPLMEAGDEDLDALDAEDALALEDTQPVMEPTLEDTQPALETAEPVVEVELGRKADMVINLDDDEIPTTQRDEAEVETSPPVDDSQPRDVFCFTHHDVNMPDSQPISSCGGVYPSCQTVDVNEMLTIPFDVMGG